MRRFVLIAVSMGLGVYAWTVAEPERAARAQAEADAEAAIALRCDAEGDLGDAECQKVLTRGTRPRRRFCERTVRSGRAPSWS
jgi:hypothetical protein